MDLQLRRRLGTVAWMFGLLVALVVGTQRQGTVEGLGMGFAPPIHISALEAGLLQSIDVELHDQVDLGTVVARIDPSRLHAKKAVAEAKLLAVQEDQLLDAMTEARRFAQGLESSLLDAARVRTKLVEDRALLSSLEERAAIESDLQSRGASSEQRVADLERRMRVVQARISAGQQAVSVASTAASAARVRNEAAPQGNEWRIVAATRQVEELQERIERLNLMAGIKGQVTWIHANPGEVVQPGDPVVQITRLATSDVVAYLPISQVHSLAPGTRARVVRASGQVLRGELVSLGAGPMQMPAQLWHNSVAPEWGVPVRIALAGGEIGPDEPVTVQL